MRTESLEIPPHPALSQRERGKKENRAVASLYPRSRMRASPPRETSARGEKRFLDLVDLPLAVEMTLSTLLPATPKGVPPLEVWIDRRLASWTCQATIWVLEKVPRMLTTLMKPVGLMPVAEVGMAVIELSTAAKMRLLLALPAVRVSMVEAAR